MNTSSGSRSGGWVAVVLAVLRRPDLWVEAARTGGALVPRRRMGHTGDVASGLRRLLPRPNDNYLRFRAETQYGDSSATPSPGDVITYLEWCRRQRALTS